VSDVRVLALDTATALTTVAVVHGDGEVIAEASHLDARRHAEALPQLVREALQAASATPRDLDLVAVGVGPGPFTGLRVGVAFARAVAQGLGVPIVGAVTLDAMAYRHARLHEGDLTVVTRSRRLECSWATYRHGLAGLVRTSGPLIAPIAGFARDGVVVGDIDGVDVVAHPSAGALGAFVLERLSAGEPVPSDRDWPEDASDGTGAPTAAILIDLAAQGRWLVPALPLYLRRPDAVPA
jgi:tRNA threonylcarbamoyladenosine biosynthesis protein TsaB